MKSNYRMLLGAAAVVTLLATFALRGTGQEDSLGKPLKLDGKLGTLKELLSAIQTQTGVAIKCPAHLSGRRLAVASTGQSVKAVLDAVCDTEGWSWHAADSGGLVIEGPIPQVKRGESLYGAVRRLTPPDLATFCYMPPSDKLQEGGGAPGGLDKRRTAVSKPLIAALSGMEGKLTGEGVKLSELKSGKEELLLLGLITSFRAEMTTRELFGNSTYLFVRPESTRLRLEKGTILMVDCPLEGQGSAFSFGANTAGNP